MKYKRIILFVLVCGIMLGLPRLIFIPTKIVSAQETQKINCRTLEGHKEGVWSVAFSPDGTLLASGSLDDTIKVWRVVTGELIRILEGHKDSVKSVVFSPDGTILASGSGDNTIKLWRVASGEVIRTLEGHKEGVWSVAFSPDGKILASGSWDRTIRLWRVPSGELIRTLKGVGSVGSIAFSPNGEILASSSWDDTIQCWRVSTGKLMRTLKGHRKSVWSVAFSPDGKILASGSWDRTIRLWRVATGELIRTLEGHKEGVHSVAFSPDGTFLASGSKIIRLWRVATGELIRTLEGHKEIVWSVAFSPDGTVLVSGSIDKTIKLWDIPELTIDVDRIPESSITKLGEDGIAVIIGVEEYKNAPKASYATRDAQVFYEYAKTVFGIPKRNIYIRTNEDATKGEFEKIFEPNGWLARRVKHGKSQVLVFISCHGAPDIKTHTPYLIPYDVDPNYAQTMGYALKRVYQNLESFGARSVTVFIDACFSGMSREKEMLLVEAKGITIVPRIPQVGKGVVVFSGAKGDQISSGYKEKKHGLFTYYLLKGLQGTADKNKDKAITFEELVCYVKAQVSETAVYLDREQTPTLLPVLEQLDEASKTRVIVRYK